MMDYLRFRCIVHATENPEKVKKAFIFITGEEQMDVKKEKGYYGNEILIYEHEIKKKKEIEKFWKRMKSLGVVEEIIPVLDEIVDSHGTLYLRFDKQEAYLGRIAIATHGDVIAMKGKIKSYPMKKKNAIENFVKFIHLI